MTQIGIVLLDDHPVVREGLLTMLEKERDIEVLASSGVAAELFELLRLHRPDVLLIDIHMDGPTFSLVQQAIEIFPELKVLFITAFHTQENLEKVKAIGGHGLVSKLEGGPGICKALRTVAEGGLHLADRQIPGPGASMRMPNVHPLSPREVDVLCRVAYAMTAKEIAKDLHISVKTVDRHKANIMEKLNLRSQIELARYAIRHGFVEA